MIIKRMRTDIFPATISFYKIHCKNPAVIHSYIGHTNQLAQRIREHHSRCMNPSDPAYDRPLYRTIRENGGPKEWEFEEIERVECDSSNYARHIENDLILIHGANLNKSFAYSKPSPAIKNTYYATHRDAILAKYKEKRLEQRERALMAQNDICICV